MRRRQFLALAAGPLALAAKPVIGRATTSEVDAGLDVGYRLRFAGADVGHHAVSVRTEPSGLTVVRHDRAMDIRMLRIRVYSRSLNSREWWDGDQLVRLESEQVKNGKRAHIRGAKSGEVFTGTGPEGIFESRASLATTEAFWTAETLERERIIDTWTGELFAPQLRAVGSGRWAMTYGDTRLVLEYDGDLLLRAEFESEGHTVHMERVRLTGPAGT
jgi:hypothetical protein